MLFELLCRIQNPDALTKAIELFHSIPSTYFSNSSGVTKFVYLVFLLNKILKIILKI